MTNTGLFQSNPSASFLISCKKPEYVLAREGQSKGFELWIFRPALHLSQHFVMAHHIMELLKIHLRWKSYLNAGEEIVWPRWHMLS